MSRSMGSWLLLCLGVIVSPALAEVPRAETFGKTAAGEEVQAFTLRNSHGMSARVITYGATLVDLVVPAKDGRKVDVALGFDSIAGYESTDNPYFGCTTGRVANRIANARFTLNGRTFTFTPNNGPNLLHGGTKRALHRVLWKATPRETADGESVEFTYTSPDGEEGFPGKLDIKITYLVRSDRNTLALLYSAVTDQATPVNLTNHTYFNLSGAGTPSVLDHELQLHADKYTPADQNLIPTGELADVAGTPLDFRQPHAIGERIAALNGTQFGGYDHNFIVNGPAEMLRPAARVKSPLTGIVLEIQSREPAIQLYTANGLNLRNGKNGQTYRKNSAFCLESQHSPDSVNQPSFPSIILQPNGLYSQVTSWTFTAE